MRKSSLILAGAAVALAGATAVTAAACGNEHVLTVRLPDGSVEHVRYTGDVAPRIVLQPAAPAMSVGPLALFDTAFGADSPFAAMERVSAEMDRQADAMMRQASAMAAAQPAQPGAAPQMAVMVNAPAGARYSYVSTTTVNGKTCTTSVNMVSQGAGKAPQMLRNVSGDCSTAMQRPTGPTPAVAPASPATPPRVTPVSAPAAPKAPAVPADSI
jgi:hypothetical protein